MIKQSFWVTKQHNCDVLIPAFTDIDLIKNPDFIIAEWWGHSGETIMKIINLKYQTHDANSSILKSVHEECQKHSNEILTSPSFVAPAYICGFEINHIELKYIPRSTELCFMFSQRKSEDEIIKFI